MEWAANEAELVPGLTLNTLILKYGRLSKIEYKAIVKDLNELFTLDLTNSDPFACDKGNKSATRHPMNANPIVSALTGIEGKLDIEELIMHPDAACDERHY